MAFITALPREAVQLATDDLDLTVVPSSAATIDTVPDEVLMLIIARVPYTREQHGDLRLVSSRFRTMVDCPVLWLQTARYQYPEQLTLADCKAVGSRKALDEMAIYEKRLECAVEKCTRAEGQLPSKSIKLLLSSGLRLLDYIGLFGIGAVGKKWFFAAACKGSALSLEQLTLLRMTISRIYGHMIPKDLYNKSPENILIDTLRNRAGVEHQRTIDELRELARQRVFEQLILSLEAPLRPTSLSHHGNQSMEIFMNTFQNFSAVLTIGFLGATNLATAFPYLKSSAQDRLLKTPYWRILPPAEAPFDLDCLSDLALSASIDRSLLLELHYQHISYTLYDEAQEDRCTEVSDIDWSAMGKQLRLLSSILHTPQ